MVLVLAPLVILYVTYLLCCLIYDLDMSRSRIQSAGPLVGPEQEVRMLRNTVTKLQQELLQSNAATQKITEQLNCMMLLVKRFVS